MIKFVMNTDLEKIPNTCAECPILNCWIPENKDGSAILKAYTKKRHPNCPLQETNEEE